MIRLFLRKLTLIVIIIPVLHMVGFYYAQFHPHFFRPSRGAAPPEISYLNYMQRIIFEGDFGQVGSANVLDVVGRPFYHSLVLIGCALLVTAFFGIVIGFISVSPTTRSIRPTALILTTAGASVPGFLLGGAVISIFVYQLLYGYITEIPLPLTSEFGIDENIILPLLVLAVRPALHVAKVTSNLVETELNQDYVRTARSKGAKWLRVYGRHIARNVIAPIILLLGQSLRFIVGGLLVAEIMFLWPGIGRFFVYSIVANENLTGQFRYFAHPELIATLAVLLGAVILSADLITSLATYAIDPRLRQNQPSTSTSTSTSTARV